MEIWFMIRKMNMHRLTRLRFSNDLSKNLLLLVTVQIQWYLKYNTIKNMQNICLGVKMWNLFCHTPYVLCRIRRLSIVVLCFGFKHDFISLKRQEWNVNAHFLLFFHYTNTPIRLLWHIQQNLLHWDGEVHWASLIL